MKRAILQVADTGPLESLVVMLRSVGYQCYLPSEKLKDALRKIGCDTVINVADLVRGMGYEAPMLLATADVEDMNYFDLYVDVKAHRNYRKVVAYFPHMENKVLWYRINGGKPEHVINARGDHGDEVNPPCPVLTPNLWYRDLPNSYACWPPFKRMTDYWATHGRGEYPNLRSPICLVHNFDGWGYGKLKEGMLDLGVGIFGEGSPSGLIPHQQIPNLLSKSLCYVHLKSSDAPGYALYEALSAACPVICTRRLIWRNRMEDLLIPNETCLVFDRETHDGLSDTDVVECVNEVRENLKRLSNLEENKRIGMAGYERLKKVMWNPQDKADVHTLQNFMTGAFK